jgi:hypothetical protein
VVAHAITTTADVTLHNTRVASLPPRVTVLSLDVLFSPTPPSLLPSFSLSPTLARCLSLALALSLALSLPLPLPAPPLSLSLSLALCQPPTLLLTSHPSIAQLCRWYRSSNHAHGTDGSGCASAEVGDGGWEVSPVKSTPLEKCADFSMPSTSHGHDTGSKCAGPGGEEGSGVRLSAEAVKGALSALLEWAALGRSLVALCPSAWSCVVVCSKC